MEYMLGAYGELTDGVSQSMGSGGLHRTQRKQTQGFIRTRARALFHD